MKRSDWSRPTTADIAYRRAGGRARYNAQRQMAAFERREWLRKALGGQAPRRGDLASLARRMGVSKATASRDVALIRRSGTLQPQVTFAQLKRAINSLIS